mmetsp:Transcript_6659/g.15174  ORF Transcript_6659/g.15174 Transcript_6659/m.15174 type:complete len:133 (-) Transcript_6659:967-1365(-)
MHSPCWFDGSSVDLVCCLTIFGVALLLAGVGHTMFYVRTRQAKDVNVPFCLLFCKRRKAVDIVGEDSSIFPFQQTHPTFQPPQPLDHDFAFTQNRSTKTKSPGAHSLTTKDTPDNDPGKALRRQSAVASWLH